MVSFLLVSVILKILYIFIRIIEGFMLQSADKFLKAICQMGDFIVIFLIHIDDAVVMRVGNMMLIVTLFHGHIPDNEAEINAENNYMWPEAVEVAKAHKAHIMVAVLGEEEKLLERGKLFTKAIIEGFMLQSADKFLKAICQMGDFIVIFLIHMDYRRLSLGTASPVVQENHIVSGATVADGHADGRILPLIDHKLTAQLSTEGAALFPSDSENAGDGHMVLCPTGRLIAGIAGVHRNAAVVLLHQPDSRRQAAYSPAPPPRWRSAHRRVAH